MELECATVQTSFYYCNIDCCNHTGKRKKTIEAVQQHVKDAHKVPYKHQDDRMWDYRHEDADSTVALYVLPERYARMAAEISEFGMDDSVHHGEARSSDNSACSGTELPHFHMNDVVHRGDVRSSNHPVHNSIDVAHVTPLPRQASANSAHQNGFDRRGPEVLDLSRANLPALVRENLYRVCPDEYDRLGLQDVGLRRANLQALVSEIHSRVCPDT